MLPTTKTGTKFSRDNRLTLPSRIQEVLKNGKKTTYKWLQINTLKRVAANDKKKKVPQKNSRLAVLVSKKALKLAVWRNTFKRTARECFRHNRNSFSSAYDIVIRTTKAPEKVSKQVFRKHINEALQKANVLS